MNTKGLNLKILTRRDLGAAGFRPYGFIYFEHKRTEQGVVTVSA